MGMYSIAIDMGGTIIKIGLIKDKELVEFRRVPIDSIKGLSPLLGELAVIINEFLANQKITKSNLSGLGIAFPGMVNSEKRIIISTNGKYEDACQIDLNKWVDNNWSCRLFLDNDARMATVGEWKFGAARGKNNVVMMTIGTGIGTGVITNGLILRGHNNQAGSLGGHLSLAYRGRTCTCGNKGCVEALASTYFLPQIVEEFSGISKKFRKFGKKITYDELFSFSAKGWSNAQKICNDSMEIWGCALVNLIHAYDPEIIILGGGVLNSKDVIIPFIRSIIKTNAWHPLGEVQIDIAELSDKAALWGLAYVIEQHNIHNKPINNDQFQLQ